jgi:hypothetical protein
MSGFREFSTGRHPSPRLRIGVAAWLIFQLATLWALVPQDCCATHKAQHQQQKAQHSTAPAGHDHHAMNHGHDAAPKAPLEQCMMRGTCKGPMSAIISLLSHHSVPPLKAFTIAPDPGVTVLARAASEHVCCRLASPDPPPPRA